jgi:uncharacterized repeat protein (TIGR03803 family)
MKSVLRFPASTLAAFLLCFASAITSPAQTFTTLLTFDGGNKGSGPGYGSLVQGLDGNLYGVTQAGGRFIAGRCGCGTVFKVTPGGTLTILHTFNGDDGQEPFAGLALATNGDFYGTTRLGGPTSGSYGDGNVFKVTPDGKFTALYDFTGYSTGIYPLGSLLQASDRSLYGTTSWGGSGRNYYVGTAFKVSSAGTLTTLRSFGGPVGYNPEAALIEASDGNFYGTTPLGGAYCVTASGCGTVYRMTPDGTMTPLHSFDGTDGSSPSGSLVQGADGSLYGTTFDGGTLGYGTVFKITTTGVLTTLHNFDGTDGALPSAGLVLATDGNFYGTTVEGGGGCGNYGCGTLFQMSPEGVLTTLHHFDEVEGYHPAAPMTQATNGSLYGTTELGGSNGVNGQCIHGCGTVFSLSMGLGPFVETLPKVGKVGSKVTILGNRLTGAASVTFNGADATFIIVSPTEIKTYVPTGATTGKVEVTLPSDRLTSNVVFRVQ